jgi:RNA polymerase sigma factor (TIGR02999 family)
VEELVRLNYAELKRLAHSRLFGSGHHTLLDTTALVHEAYVRLAKSGLSGDMLRVQFLAYAARAMRSVIVDSVRARSADRRGGDAIRVTLNTGIANDVIGEEEIMRVHVALDELAKLDAELARIVELKYFAGLSEVEIGQAIGASERTVRRQWDKARRVLKVLMDES